MSNPFPAPFPAPDDDQSPDDIPTTELDGETELDPDANEDLVDSATADRLAADGDGDDEL